MSLKKVMTADVVTIRRDATLLDAARKMREFHVGDVVVIEFRDGHEHPVGILTDRDIVLEGVAFDLDLSKIKVEDAMATELICVHEATDLFEVLEVAKNKGVRRIPVIDTKGIVKGIVSVDDILNYVISHLSGLSKFYDRQLQREVKMRADL